MQKKGPEERPRSARIRRKFFSLTIATNTAEFVTRGSRCVWWSRATGVLRYYRRR